MTLQYAIFYNTTIFGWFSKSTLQVLQVPFSMNSDIKNMPRRLVRNIYPNKRRKHCPEVEQFNDWTKVFYHFTSNLVWISYLSPVNGGMISTKVFGVNCLWSHTHKDLVYGVAKKVGLHVCCSLENGSRNKNGLISFQNRVKMNMNREFQRIPFSVSRCYLQISPPPFKTSLSPHHA